MSHELTEGTKEMVSNGWTWAQVPDMEGLLTKDLSDGARVLFVYMCWRRNQKGQLWPGIAAMALDLGVSVPTIHKRLRELEAAGMVVKKRRGSTSSLYTIDAGERRQCKAGFTSEVKEALPKQQSDNETGTLPDPVGSGPAAQAAPLVRYQVPDPKPPEAPSTFQDWQRMIKASKNRPAVLAFMVRTLFPDNDVPEYGYIGKVSKAVGGEGRLADLLWRAASHPPTGDVLAFIQGSAKRDKANGNGHKPTNSLTELPPNYYEEAAAYYNPISLGRRTDG